MQAPTENGNADRRPLDAGLGTYLLFKCNRSVVGEVNTHAFDHGSVENQPTSRVFEDTGASGYCRYHINVRTNSMSYFAQE